MALTRAERNLQKEVEAISKLAKIDYWNIETTKPKGRKVRLQLAKSAIVIGDIVAKYTGIDEMLAAIICNYFFPRPKKDFEFRELWRTKKFRIFVHYITDDIFLLQKLRIVHAIRPLPSSIRQKVEKMNAVRNAFAHSMFPENRRQYMKEKKVLYGGADIRSPQGLQNYQQDFNDVWDVLIKRVRPK